MKVKLTRDHLTHKKGEEVDVTEQRAHYWQRIGLVNEDDEEDDNTPKKKKRKTTHKKK